MSRFTMVIAMLFLGVSVLAQSLPTATLTGKVTADGAALPGVTVTVTSPNLQGARTAETSSSGDYLVPLLPPGEYLVRYELAGMQSVTRRVTLTVARTDHIDIDLRPSAIAEAITVTAETPLTAAVESTAVSTNFQQSMVEHLPVLRDLENVALLAPGVAPTGPGDNLVISGAMSFDSLYLVNGAVVNENLRGQPHDLFIEDAIQETTVMTGGAISAEYGHFTGGVVSAITKSGGNQLNASYRANLSNESWNAETPVTEAQEDKINYIHEATVGGPVLRDRIWFFGAGRLAERNEIRQTVLGRARQGDQDANGNQLPIGELITPVTYTNANEEMRLEGKVTGSIASKHTLVASYLDLAETETNQTGQTIMDLRSLVPERETPNTLLALNYNGTLTDRVFLEAQYSKKDFAFVGGGSTSYDNIFGTLMLDRGRGTRYWSPTFRNTPEGEQRDIRVYTAKATYFLPTRSIGSHEVRVGYEDFNEVRQVNNHQQGSDFRISVPNTIIRGDQIFPVMPGGSGGTLTRIQWTKIFVLSQGSDYSTRSFYVNDRWNLNDHWTFNLGLRYDKNDAISGAHTFQIADDSAVSPRLAAHYDIFGNGRLVANVSYGHFVGRLAEGAANDADPAGRQSSIQWNYRGPGINTDPNALTSALIPTDKALETLFKWFFDNGGFDMRPFRTTPSIPGVESILDPNGLESPLVKEYTLGIGSAIGTRGYARADLVYRNWDKFYTSYRNTATGKTTDPLGTQFDLSIIRSDDAVYDREYTGVQTQFNYRILKGLFLGGTYTWSRLVGNVTGEDSGSGPLVGAAGEYPEYRRADWNYPTGYLTGDVRNRARVWVSYDLPTPAGEFNVSLLQNYTSGLRSSVDGDIDPRPYVTNPGYLTPPATVSYFFGGRGNFRGEAIHRTDLAINYSLKTFGAVELFLQPEVINLFNAQGIESWDEEVLTAVDCPPTGTLASGCQGARLQPFNPFTERPIEGTHFKKGPDFGQPDSEGDYQQARTFRFSVGLRF